MKDQKPNSRTVVLSILCILSVLWPAVAPALEMEKLKVQRQEVFEFTEKPKVTREGDRITIAFATKDFCDATVAIEDEDGTIVRHLASGVLGRNAPLPFQKDSLKQSIVWDGKDEIGRYVDDKDSHTVRVSLGLKPRFERTLYWSGQKMAAGSTGMYCPIMAAAAEGVYVWFEGATPQLRLFDHDGNYVRTLYPFPADKLDRVVGLKWQTYPPDNERLPSKLLSHDQDGFLPDEDIKSIVAGADRIGLLASGLLTIGKDGSTGGQNLYGPEVSYRSGEGEAATFIRPHGAALSPDGKRLYLTAYNRMWHPPGYPSRREWRHDVNVIDTTDGAKMAPFAKGADGKPGADNAHFKCPMSVACDASGRVYVADTFNDRIQVYQPDGSFLKTIPFQRPGIVKVNPGSGEIWVVTSQVPIYDARGLDVDTQKTVPTRLVRLGTVDDPSEKAAWPLPAPDYGYQRHQSLYDINVELDFQADPPTLWTSLTPGVGGHNVDERCNVRLYVIQDRKLVLKRAFGADATKALVRARAPHFNRPRIWVNPATGMLYLGLIGWDTAVSCKSFAEVLLIDPDSGKIKRQDLPTNAEDLGFDWEGRLYLRGQDFVVRFDALTWREIPYDYGEERVVCFDDGLAKPYKANSALIMPGCMGCFFHQGGLGVTPNGTIVVGCINPNNAAERKRMAEKNIHVQLRGKGAYTAPVYPGRNAGWETHVFDAHGRLVKADVAPGIGYSNFLQIDRDNNIYVLAASTPYLDGQRYFNGRGCTLLKLVPGKMKCVTTGGLIPLPEALRPKRPPDMTRPDPTWVEGAEWLFGPVGADGHYGSGGKCDCYVHARFSLDYYGRSFVPEVDRFRAVVLDTNGNVMTRLGHYGNVDDGMPLVKDGGPPTPRSIGGDEVAILHAMNPAVHSDRRFFLADVGSHRIVSVRLGYHATEKVALKDVKDQKK